MQTYESARFSPPAPVAAVILRNPENGAIVSDIPMLVDTGADVTLVPTSFVRQLGVVVSAGNYELTGFDGTRSFAQSAQFHLELLGKTFKGRFLLIDQEWGLLGRDILNHLSLVFDGPRQSWGEA